MMILVRQILALKKERDAYKNQLLFILKHLKTKDLTYEDCQNAVSTMVRYNEKRDYNSTQRSLRDRLIS
jgi:hypothetical protein